MVGESGLHASKVTESIVFARTWVVFILLFEMLVDDGAGVLTEHGLTDFHERRVEVLIQIILRRINIWSWSSNFLGWRCKSISCF
jgi:hypothetical protein